MSERSIKHVINAVNFEQFQRLCEFVVEAAVLAEQRSDAELRDLCLGVYGDLKNSKWGEA